MDICIVKGCMDLAHPNSEFEMCSRHTLQEYSEEIEEEGMIPTLTAEAGLWVMWVELQRVLSVADWEYLMDDLERIQQARLNRMDRI